MSTKKDSSSRKDQDQKGPAKAGSGVDRGASNTTSKKSDRAEGGKTKVDREDEEGTTNTKNR